MSLPFPPTELGCNNGVQIPARVYEKMDTMTKSRITHAIKNWQNFQQLQLILIFSMNYHLIQAQSFTLTWISLRFCFLMNEGVG